ncbi:MAG: bifunctional folylpolyglutamate synthase/dihydrofolate synthase [Timaviella obliquedivisa GSE-PSE-MK23-08B]|jgi:dihydrofolate synthase/folylpolyglutamate synthase|nr:bifunctional folylpolyglutamate synthase/dihydrofolate synthase [Timaviella obliquedivisa GSE-PSE-MK23-08B]
MPFSSDAQPSAILNRFTHFGVELGLERIERLLNDLCNPQRQVPIIHVAGSNGKGSTCAFLSAVLTAAGYRVGRYTSPHLVSWCERISLNGQDISPAELHHLLLKVVAAIDLDYSSPTQFEIITAVAWLYFAQQQVDVAVVEVGLGGRLDATNVCDRPLVSIITSLSREHWQRLGDTLAKISYEKAGILKPRCPAVIAPQPAEAEAVLQARLSELNCPVTWVDPEASRRYSLSLPGEHQLINAALAIATFHILQQQGWKITEDHIVQGLATAQWQGRLQWMQWRHHNLLIDGAHNPAGAKMLRRYIDSLSLDNQNVNQDVNQVTRSIHWVMGMIANKDHGEVFQELLRAGDRLYLVPVPEHLPTDMDALAQVAQTACPSLVHCGVYADVIEGLEAAFEADLTEQNSTTVLCGSLYLIGHFFSMIQPDEKS